MKIEIDSLDELTGFIQIISGKCLDEDFIKNLIQNLEKANSNLQSALENQNAKSDITRSSERS